MEKGREYLERAVALEPRYAPAWVQLGDYYITGAFVGRAPARVMWPKALEAAQRAVSASTLALAALGLGDHVRALDWLEDSVDELDPNLINVMADPCFEALHADSRYQALLRRMNLA